MRYFLLRPTTHCIITNTAAKSLVLGVVLARRESTDSLSYIYNKPMPCLIILILALFVTTATAFAMSRELYGVPNSGWTSSSWNWGYAQGTGHDCAAICRRQYSSRQARQELVDNLLSGSEPRNFEEIKLVLALAWQRGRWDGSDGGSGGYGIVLQQMAEAERYEDSKNGAKNLIMDMSDPERFVLLDPKPDQLNAMQKIRENVGTNIDAEQRQCSGLVLQAMGFVESGL